MRGWDDLAPYAAAAAAELTARWGPPDAGIVLGSGWRELATALGAADEIVRSVVPGSRPNGVPGHDGGVASARPGGASVWVFLGRTHLYEGLGAAEVAQPIRILAAAGARRVLLTCAAGGLRDDDRPGDFAVIADHLNLTGEDPVAAVPAERRRPAFPDLGGLYDRRGRELLRAALERSVRVREGILAGVCGPCFETAAEVRMLRLLGADLVSMSVVAEALCARYLGLRVAALACISNRGTGMDDAPIEHSGVLDVVTAAVRDGSAALAGAVESLCERAVREPR